MLNCPENNATLQKKKKLFANYVVQLIFLIQNKNADQSIRFKLAILKSSILLFLLLESVHGLRYEYCNFTVVLYNSFFSILY